jgi:CelD/BcsL family acetyltransferase involved in cellulose biosynthesis
VLRTRVLTGPGFLEEAKSEWQALIPDSPTATPFQTWEWQSAWWRHFSRLKRPRLILVHEGDDLVGLVPLTVSKGPWRALRAMGSGASDYLHPLARAGYEEQVGSALAEHLAEAKDFDLLDLHQVRETQPIARTKLAEPTEQATCLVLDLPDSYDAYLGTLGKSLRYDVRKLDKSLFNEGRATVQQVEAREIVQGMEMLFEQHKKRWRKRGLPGAFIGRLQTFHQDWATHAIDKGWLWLSILRLDGEAVGAIYAMALGNTCYYYQAGFDPAKGSISPGTLLVAATIRRAIDEGKTQFDFLRGDEPYKRRWKPQHEYKNLRLVAARNPRGLAGVRWIGVAGRVEAKVRDRLEGKGVV